MNAQGTGRHFIKITVSLNEELKNANKSKTHSASVANIEKGEVGKLFQFNKKIIYLSQKEIACYRSSFHPSLLKESM